MKLPLALLAFALAGWSAAFADPTATLTADVDHAPYGGGTVTFTATISGYTSATALGFEVVLPSDWAYSGTTATTPPAVTPDSGATGTLGWAYVDIPDSPATFTFTATCPAGLTADQTIAASAHVRVSGTLTPLTVDAVVLAAPAVPTVTTGTLSSGRSVASVAGEVTAGNGETVTARGVVYGTGASPEVGTDTAVAAGSGTGSFNAWLSGLSAGTTYHVRTYATNAVGTGYGDDATFTTFDPMSATVVTSITSTGVSGTAEPGSIVAVFNGTASLGTTNANASGNWTLAVALADGSYSITATATDAEGNTSSTSTASSATIDTTAPTLDVVSLVSGNATPTAATAGDTVTLSFKPSETLQTPSVTLAGESVTPSYDSTAGTWSATHTVTAADTEGAASFEIAFSDVAGNAGTAVTATTDSSAVTIDLTAPETTLDSTPATLSNTAAPSFAFSGDDGTGSGVASFEASVDGGSYAAVTSPLALTGLVDGAHTFAIYAIDAAGNVDATPATYSWTIDTTAPTVPTALAGSATSTTATALTWTASTDTNGVASYEVYRGSTAIGTITTASYGDTGLTAGTAYTYTVVATDAAGNTSAASASVTVSTQLDGAQTIAVTTTDELLAALNTAIANPAATFTITVAAGTYTPTAGLTIGTDGLTLEGGGTISGSGLTSGELLTISGDNVMLSGLTFADGTITITAGADTGTVADCTFSAAGIGGTGCTGWTIAGGAFTDATTALSFTDSADLTLTDNVIVDCAQALVLSDLSGPTVRNNFIANNSTTNALASIVLTEVTGAQIDNNSIYQAGTAAAAIEYAGSSAVGAIRNNLANKPVTATGTATATLATNYTAATSSWFTDVTAGDLHLAATQSAVVDAGTTISDLTVDIDGDARPTGSACDIGADEYQPDTVAPSVPTDLKATVLSTSRITLSWTASTDSAPSGVTATGVTGYRIYRGGTVIGTSTTTSYADSGLTAGTTYSYKVCAYDGAANESAASSAVSATTTTSSASDSGSDSGSSSGGGGACGLLLPAVLALLAFGRRRAARR